MDTFANRPSRVRELSREAPPAFQTSDYFKLTAPSNVQMPAARLHTALETNSHTSDIADSEFVKRARRETQNPFLPRSNCTTSSKLDSNSPILAAEYERSLLLDLDKEHTMNLIQNHGVSMSPVQYSNPFLYHSGFAWPGYFPYQSYQPAFPSIALPHAQATYVAQQKHVSVLPSAGVNTVIRPSGSQTERCVRRAVVILSLQYDISHEKLTHLLFPGNGSWCVLTQPAERYLLEVITAPGKHQGYY